MAYKTVRATGRILGWLFTLFYMYVVWRSWSLVLETLGTRGCGMLGVALIALQIILFVGSVVMILIIRGDIKRLRMHNGSLALSLMSAAYLRMVAGSLAVAASLSLVLYEYVYGHLLRH